MLDAIAQDWAHLKSFASSPNVSFRRIAVFRGEEHRRHLWREAVSARIGSNINCVSGHLAYYAGAAGTARIETAADGRYLARQRG